MKIPTKQQQEWSNNTAIVDLEMKGNARWEEYLKTCGYMKPDYDEHNNGNTWEEIHFHGNWKNMASDSKKGE